MRKEPAYYRYEIKRSKPHPIMGFQTTVSLLSYRTEKQARIAMECHPEPSLWKPTGRIIQQ